MVYYSILNFFTQKKAKIQTNVSIIMFVKMFLLPNQYKCVITLHCNHNTCMTHLFYILHQYNNMLSFEVVSNCVNHKVFRVVYVGLFKFYFIPVFKWFCRSQDHTSFWITLSKTENQIGSRISYFFAMKTILDKIKFYVILCQITFLEACFNSRRNWRNKVEPDLTRQR